jgi:LacI family transcriptional regulator
MKECNIRKYGLKRDLCSITRSKYIGILIKDLNNPFYTAMTIGAISYAKRNGYSLVILTFDDKHEFEEKLLYPSKDILGLIISPVLGETLKIEHYYELKLFSYPFVLLENIKGIPANFVTIDNIEAIRVAVKYLIENGHTKIVHFAGPPLSSQTRERIEGFRHAFSESSLVFKKEMIVPIGTNYADSFINTIKYFKKKNKRNYPSAIVCFNDHQAFAVINALKEMNIEVPRDISIIGNDDIYYAKYFSVPLTTMRAPLNEMGMKAAEILIRNIESPKVLPEERVIFKTEFVIRESTKIMNFIERSQSPKQNYKLVISEIMV